MENQDDIKLAKIEEDFQEKVKEAGNTAVDVIRQVTGQLEGAEARPEQEQATAAFAKSIASGTHVLVEAPTGTGKALYIDTPILTNKGWSTMGKLVVGDVIYNENGEETTVIDALPVLNNRQCYEVVFNDGSKIIADGEHLWATYTRKKRETMFDSKKRDRIKLSLEGLIDLKNSIEKDYEYIYANQVISPLVVSRRYKASYNLALTAASKIQVSETKRNIKYYDTKKLLEFLYIEMISKINDNVNGFSLETLTTEEIKNTLVVKNYTNHAVPVVSKALRFNHKELIIHPYALGVWLGDGNSSGSGLTCFDQEIINKLVSLGFSINSHSAEGSFGIDISNEVQHRWRESFTTQLRALNVLNNKHIPVDYLMSSKEQRLELLAGLIDTDGSIGKTGAIEFYASNEILANQVRKLVNSLGYKASIRSKIPTNTTTGKQGKIAYCVSFVLNPLDEPTFKLISRKQTLITERLKNYTPERNKLRYIIEVNEIDSVPVRCITVDSPSHLFLAGETLIPTHNTMSYLIPAVLSGEKVVVSTATKQLSEQIVNKDVPFLKKALLETDSPVKHFTAGLLKGRDNYYCLYKEAESSRLDAQFDDGEVKSSKSDANKIAVEMRYLKAWADKTNTGDRAEAPDVVSDKVWRQFSSNSTECIGKNACPFGASCFAEFARDKAKDADIVVTNHAMVAHDMISEASTLGERSVYIIDEVHEFDKYVTDAWSATLAPSSIRDAAKTLKVVEAQVDLPDDEFSVSLFLNKTADTLKKALDLVDAGRIDAPTGSLKQLLSDLRVRCSQASAAVGKKISDKKGKEDDKGDFIMARNKLDSLIEAVDLLMSETNQIVRWISESGNKDNPVRQLQAAPLRIGPTLQSKLQEKEVTMIGTSATVRVGGSFDIPKHNLGFDLVPNVKTFALNSPFDFKKQAMLYIPDDSFPAPVGQDRREHQEACKAVSFELIRALNGRAMVLTTTTFEVRDIAEYLRKKLPDNTILAQGDMPNSQLVERYREDEHSVLVATMGLWHGLDVSGSTSSLVIITKIPFRPMNDPLFQARREYADEEGRDGFNDVFVADANVMLTQGVGRLIRRKTDKGVVAILDTRLIDKKYGREMINSFPPISVFRNRAKVVAALERLADLYAKDATIADS